MGERVGLTEGGTNSGPVLFLVEGTDEGDVDGESLGDGVLAFDGADDGNSLG